MCVYSDNITVLTFLVSCWVGSKKGGEGDGGAWCDRPLKMRSMYIAVDPIFSGR